MQFPNYGGIQNVMTATAIPEVKGIYPLHDVYVTIAGPFGMEEVTHLPTRPNQLGKPISLDNQANRNCRIAHGSLLR